MKYLVTIATGKLESATCFLTYNDAILYINDCIDAANTKIKDFDSYAPDCFKMVLMDGRDFNIRIELQPDADVRFDLKTVKNGHAVETRRFTKREFAVAYAHKIIQTSGCRVEYASDEEGFWSAKSEQQGIRIDVGLCLAVLGASQNSDYDLLGIKSGATEAEIKKAYRQKVKENHPDKGGDPVKFEKIQKAYERILKSKAPKSRSVKKYYDSRDMVSFFKEYGIVEREERNRMQSRPRMNLYDELTAARAQASSTAGGGAILMAFGGTLLIFMATNGKIYPLILILAVGLIGWGVFKLICGLYYQSKIEKILQKFKD